jgi:hypothetical protein
VRQGAWKYMELVCLCFQFLEIPGFGQKIINFVSGPEAANVMRTFSNEKETSV